MSDVVRISEAANLGIHTMVLLALDSGRPMTVRRAAEQLPVSENHLAKVLQRLSRAKLVTSTRGPSGGFMLSRDAAQITLLEVFEAIEGSVDSKGCLLGRPRCQGTCFLGDFLSRAQAEFRAQLEKTRLSDAAKAFRGSSHP